MTTNETQAMAWKMVVLIVILVISCVGNVLVIIVVHRSQRNQWTTNHFVLNLAVVNLLAPIVYLPMILDWVHRGNCVAGNVGCRIWAFLGHFNAIVSAGIVCCMSFDRFYLTAYPLTFKLSKTQTKKLILAIWLVAAAISSPLLHFYEVDSKKLSNCSAKSSGQWTAYICTFASLFLIPLAATYVMYVKVYLCIIARNSKSAKSKRFARNVPRTKIKVTKLLFAQVVVLTLLWLPFIVNQIVSSFSEFVRDDTAANPINTVTLYLAYASSAASPIIYAVFSGDFRRGCKQILMKYDASLAYRLPAPLERKNRVDFITPDLNSGQSVQRSFLKRESREQISHLGMTFEQPKLAWS